MNNNTYHTFYKKKFQISAWLMEMRAVEGASEQVREQNAKEEEEQATFDLENGQMKFEEKVMSDHNNNGDTEFQASKFQRLNPTNPLRIVINNATRVASLSPDHHHQSQQPPPSQPPSTPSIPQQTVTLNSRRYTNKITLFLFLLHMLIAIALVAFLIFKGVEGLIQPSSDSKRRKQTRVVKYFLPQVEAASVLSIVLALTWQTAIRKWPNFMTHFTLWCSFFMSLSAGILLLCFQKPPTDGVGVSLIAFLIGNGLYAVGFRTESNFAPKF
ncbi:hypothetical protein S245_044142 [Arachis hypogaea]